MPLQFFKDPNMAFTLMQNSWKSKLDPLLGNPSLQSNILENVSLKTGANSISHLLGKKLTGWRIVRQRALSSIYDTQDTNQTPQLTLNLVASAPVSVNIEVF